jgi:ribose-phosphate pyrophosphokinase
VILVDDEVETCGSVVQDVELLENKGANKIILVFVHLVLSGYAAERLSSLPITENICTDTKTISTEKKEVFGDKITVLSIDSLLGEVILRAHEGRSVGEMFNE